MKPSESVTFKGACEAWAETQEHMQMNAEMYWGQNFSSDKQIEAALTHARAKGWSVSDETTSEFDAGRYFYDCYKDDPDKGLS